MPYQSFLSYTPHDIGGSVVTQRHADGYINASAMCKAAGRTFSDYLRLNATAAFISELTSALGIPRAELIQTLSGGTPHLQGSWVHPQVAVNLAQWVSPRFAVLVSQWVYDWMRGGGAAPSNLPYHLRRYVANQRNVPAGHFSVLTEMTLVLIGPMESVGYRLPEKLWPDISQGRMFAKFLRDAHGVDTEAVPTYHHEFEDYRPPVQAKAYPNSYLALFRDHFAQVWMPQRMVDYFEEKDPAALKFLARAFVLPDSVLAKLLELDELHNPPTSIAGPS